MYQQPAPASKVPNRSNPQFVQALKPSHPSSQLSQAYFQRSTHPQDPSMSPPKPAHTQMLPRPAHASAFPAPIASHPPERPSAPQSQSSPTPRRRASAPLPLPPCLPGPCASPAQSRQLAAARMRGRLVRIVSLLRRSRSRRGRRGGRGRVRGGRRSRGRRGWR